MFESRPSLTAERVAMRRAAHQILDVPPIFEDPFALKIAPLSAEDIAREQEDAARANRLRRALLAVRSRYAEDVLAGLVAEGINQYVVLGAGLDTFAYRNPYPRVRVFEVDHPATQAWKRERLASSAIMPPPSLTFVPIDFERERLSEVLTHASLGEPWRTFFDPQELEAWLREIGFTEVEDVDADALNNRYFSSRADGLMIEGIGRMAHLSRARV